MGTIFYIILPHVIDVADTDFLVLTDDGLFFKDEFSFFFEFSPGFLI